jgi:hypothetical protein
VHSAGKARKLDPLKVFNLTEEEYRLLEHVASRPRSWSGFSRDTVKFLLRDHLIRLRDHGRIVVISCAGAAILDAISTMLCT